MDFDFSPQEETFRREVKGFLAKNVKELPDWWGRRDVAGPDPESDEYHEFSLWWHRKLYDAGLVGIAWPKEYGGRGATLMEQVVFGEEFAKHGAPGPANSMGLSWVGWALINYGTEEQKKRYLPKILTAEEIWCTFYSEPNNGSDMANAQTRAVEDGDDFVVNGQKIWSSGAHRADFGVLLARTDPEARKHRGLSYLFLNVHSPGVTLRPLVQMHGRAGFNESFFDDVRFPKHQIIGQLNMGWYIAAGALEYERLIGGAIERNNTLRDITTMTKELKRHGQLLTKDWTVRQRMAQFHIEVNILRLMGMRQITRRLREGAPGPEGSLTGFFQSEHNQRVQDFVMQLQGPYGQLMRDSKHAIEQGRWQNSFLTSRGSTIAAGTSEIRRNIVAMRVLGLPRSY